MTSIALAPGAGLLLRYANRHGLITGATGTGKSVTLQTLAEGFSRAGVPVFLADVKGDLAGLATANPVEFYDLFGQQGRRASVTVRDFGPELFARVLGLTDIQAGVLDVAFAAADAARLPFGTLQDLRAVLGHVVANARQISADVELVTPATLAVIQRALVGLERAGGSAIFGAPSFEPLDLLRRAVNGRGVISILAADRLMTAPDVYAAWLLWMLGALFARLPEVGDAPAPRLVLVFDEAHLLFADAPAALVRRIERTVRLIRSKGVGVYFVTQAPADIPATIVAQLGNRIQHGLRTATPADLRGIRAAADSLPTNPRLGDVAALIGRLGVGEALVSTIDTRGAPSPVQRVRITRPVARLGTITPDERAAVIVQSTLLVRPAPARPVELARAPARRVNILGPVPEGREWEAIVGFLLYLIMGCLALLILIGVIAGPMPK